MIKLFRDPIYCLNTLILSILWSTSAYAFYFTEFYMKYVPVSNIYYLALMMGVSDLITSMTFNLIHKKLTSKEIITISTLLLSCCGFVFALVLYAKTDDKNDSLALEIFYTAMVFGMRFFSALTFISVYFANNEYFPTLLKGAIFAITNVAARLASVMSPLIAEWMNNPSITVAIVAFLACLASVKLVKPIETPPNKKSDLEAEK